MKVAADLHTHSLASTHAYSTLDEICVAAARRRLAAVALTDHAPLLPDSPHVWHFWGLNRLPKTIHGLRLLSGAEVNVSDTQGTLDIPDKVAQRLDFVIASMHHIVFPPTDEDTHTQAWLAMARNPLVDCLGHMGQPTFPFDIDTVVTACRETGTVIEINEGSYHARPGSAEVCRRIAQCCKEKEVSIVVNSDAHSAYQVGDVRLSLEMLAEIDFPAERVINATAAQLQSYFLQRKQRDIFVKEKNEVAYWD